MTKHEKQQKSKQNDEARKTTEEQTNDEARKTTENRTKNNRARQN